MEKRRYIMTEEEKGIRPHWEWKKEEDPDYYNKVKRVREATGKPLQQCDWMLQICYGFEGTAIELLNKAKWTFA